MANYVSVKGASYESLALATVVPYPLPLVKFARDPASFEYWWRLLYYAFELPSPYEIPALPYQDLVGLLHRYCDAAKELASSACLADGASVTMEVRREDDGSQEEWVYSEFPPTEVIRGFLALFRQFYAPGEPASFTKVKSALMRAAQAATDADAEARLSLLKAWGRAQGKLRAYNLKYVVGTRLVEQGRYTGEIPDDGSPERLISTFSYGEHLHWGDKREQVARWEADRFLGPWHRIRFLEALAALAYLYMGYAVVVARSLGRDGELV